MIKVLILILFIITPISAQTTITLVTGDWEPYTSSSNREFQILETLVREAFLLENIRIDFKYYPWIRSYEMVRTGTAKGTFPWILTEERSELFYVSEESIITERTVFFHHRDLVFDWSDISDLYGYSIGGTIGYAYLDPLRDAGLNIEYVGKEELNFKKLLAGRIDLYPAPEVVGTYFINKLFSEADSSALTYHSKPLSEEKYFLLVSKNIPEGEFLVQKFDSGMRKLKSGTRYEEILSAIRRNESKNE